MKSTYWIYKLVNTSTGRSYTGCTTNYAVRIAAHQSSLKINKHGNFLMQADYNKGERFEPVMVKELRCTKAEALAAETLAIEQNTYNIFKAKESVLRPVNQAA